MGVFTRGSANVQPSAEVPIDTSRNFLKQVCVSGGKKTVFSFQAILRLFRLKKKTIKNRGSPKLFSHPKSYFFWDLKHHAQFQNPTICPSGRKVSEAEKNKKKRLIVDT
jgi:hypothetical protein